MVHPRLPLTPKHPRWRSYDTPGKGRALNHTRWASAGVGPTLRSHLAKFQGRPFTPMKHMAKSQKGYAENWKGTSHRVTNVNIVLPPDWKQSKLFWGSPAGTAGAAPGTCRASPLFGGKNAE